MVVFVVDFEVVIVIVELAVVVVVDVEEFFVCLLWMLN